MYERVMAWLISFMASRDRHAIQTAQYTVGTAAVQVLARNAHRYGAVITNAGAGNIYVGGSDDSLFQTGHVVPGGAALSLIGAAEVWAVSDASGPYTVTSLIEVER